jgi:serine O-acetyltransferase
MFRTEGSEHFSELLKADILTLVGEKKHHNNFWIFLFMIKFLIISSGFREVFLYRIGHSWRNILPLYVITFIVQSWFSNIEIPFAAKIGPGLVIPHPQDIVFSPECILGARALIYQGVTIGVNLGKNIDGRMVAIIGDDVQLATGAKIIGPVIIGDKVIVGANSVVIADIPSNSVVVGIPAKIVGIYSERMNRYH